MLKKKFETYYICSEIENVIGRRYNIGIELEEDEKPDISGYCYKETIAGFFRSWRLNEIHLQLTMIINKFQVVNLEQMVKVTGMVENTCLKYLEECIRLGLLCENTAVDKNGSIVFNTIYFIDTGGIFALEEAGVKYNKIPFTSSIDQRINTCRRNIYVTEQGMKEVPKGIIFLEDLIESPISPQEGVVLYDSLIALNTNVFDEVKRNLIELSDAGLKSYDLHTRKYGIDNQY